MFSNWIWTCLEHFTKKVGYQSSWSHWTSSSLCPQKLSWFSQTHISQEAFGLKHTTEFHLRTMTVSEKELPVNLHYLICIILSDNPRNSWLMQEGRLKWIKGFDFLRFRLSSSWVTLSGPGLHMGCSVILWAEADWFYPWEGAGLGK